MIINHILHMRTPRPRDVKNTTPQNGDSNQGLPMPPPHSFLVVKRAQDLECGTAGYLLTVYPWARYLNSLSLSFVLFLFCFFAFLKKRDTNMYLPQEITLKNYTLKYLAQEVLK